MSPELSRAGDSASGVERSGVVFTPSFVIWFSLAVIVLTAVLFVGLNDLRDVYGTSEAVAHSYAVKAALEELLATTVDAETGERGFVITGADRYLEPYDRARLAVATNLGDVRTLTTGNPEQRVDLDQLSELTQRKFAELASTIALRRDAGFQAAQARVGDDVGRRLMADMRTIVTRMEAREDDLLADRSAVAARSYRSAHLTHIASVAVGSIAIAVLFGTTIRYAYDRTKATRALEEKQSQLIQALRLKDEFVAVVSHELRTPTTTILGWARMIEQHAVSPDRIEAVIATICRSAESLRQLIEDLLDTSQLVSGRMRLVEGPVDLRAVVAEATDAVRLSAENKGVTLRVEAQRDQPLVMQGDANRLKQVVWNLLTNAIKFTPAGGNVTVRLAAAGRGLHLEVTDTGVGIDRDFLPHVFERFRQGQIGPRQPGIGLGLAIVRHLVELHGGVVSARSDGVGEGTSFAIDLPVAGDARPAEGAAWSAAS